MKKAYLLFILTLIFAGCKKDSTSTTNPIVGKWTGGEEVAVYFVNNVEVYREVLSPGSADNNSYIEFKTDGTIYITGKSNGVYTSETGTYSLLNSNSILHMTVAGITGADKTIVSVDDKTLKLSTSTSGGTTSYTKNGVMYSANGETIYQTFTRL